MNVIEKSGVVISSLLAAVTFLTAFTFTDVPEHTVYVALILLFVSGFSFSYVHSSSPVVYLQLFFVISCPLLIVIDPVEIGLYGWDSNHSFVATQQLLSGSSAWEVLQTHRDRPILFILVAILYKVTESPLISISKYIPIVTSLTPIFTYLIARTFGTPKQAVGVGFATAILRMMFLFESKYVPEALAIPMLYMGVFMYFIQFRQWSEKKSSYTSNMLILCVSVVALTHSMATVSIILLFGLIALSERMKLGSKNKINPSTNSRLLLVSVFACVIFAVVFVFLDSRTFRVLVLSLLNPSPGGSVGSDGTAPDLLQLFIANVQLLVILAFSILNGLVLLPGYDVKSWEIGVLVYNGIFIGLFGLQSVFGAITPLDPTRTLIFSVPTLVLLALRVLDGLKTNISLPARRQIGVFLIIIFAVVQVAAVPPHIMYSDPTDESLKEGHRSSQERDAAVWANHYSDSLVVGEKKDLWKYFGGNKYSDPYFNVCPSKSLLVDRPGYKLDVSYNHGRIYDNGGLSLNYCLTNN